VGGGGNCAADTEVSKQSNVGRDETMVGSSKVVVGHILIEKRCYKFKPVNLKWTFDHSVFVSLLICALFSFFSLIVCIVNML